ncbi:MAG: hypothetical protein JXP34_20075 [Planctomycetes bacterium]|nr:hypothetical protein [Planctomycetota bacterium]
MRDIRLAIAVACLLAGTTIDARTSRDAGPSPRDDSTSDPSPFAGAIDFVSMAASAGPDGVWIEWETEWRPDTLGFHVLRERDGRRVRITDEMIAGPALRDGADPRDGGIRSYSFRDREGTESARYWIEDLDLRGRGALHGPLIPASGAPARRFPSRRLSEIGRGADRRFGRARSFPALASTARAVTPAISRGKTSSSPTPEDLEIQWGIAAAGAVKIRVKEEGWYRLERADLLAAGLDPLANPRNLHLFAGGREEPLSVSGQYDLRLDPGDAIEFYGIGADTPWSDARTYWLFEGTTPGRRIPGIRYLGPGAESPTSFPFSVEREDRTTYFAALLNGDAENFYGPIVSQVPVEQVLRFEGIDGSSSEYAALEVSLQGVTEAPHRVAAILDGIEVGEIIFEGADPATGRFPIDAADLASGMITVTLVAREGDMDVVLIDAIRLAYPRLYEAEGDVLRAKAIGGRWLTIRGFASPSIRVADVTDPARPFLARGVVQPDAGGYAIRLKVPRSGCRELLAFSDDAVRAAASVEADWPSALHAEDNEADLLVIGSAPLRDALAPLLTWREAQGLSVGWIEIEDIYDEFGFGEKSAPAVRDFLRRAHDAWRRPPRYVILAGDATFDPRDRLRTGSPDIVPAALVETSFLETASDDWFADFDGDDLPDLAIGRLPVRNAREAATAVWKIVAYESAAASPWSDRIIFASDQAEGFDFPAATRELEAAVPGDRTIREVFRGAQSRGDLLALLNEGAGMVTYIGHGSVEVWNGGLFSSVDARALANDSRLPIVVALTCLNGFFHDLYSESVAEAFLRAEEGGAAAAWASSGLTGPTQQLAMGREWMRLIFDDPQLTLGEAVREAKRAAADPDVRRTWILFGDPSMRLR